MASQTQIAPGRGRLVQCSGRLLLNIATQPYSYLAELKIDLHSPYTAVLSLETAHYESVPQSTTDI